MLIKVRNESDGKIVSMELPKTAKVEAIMQEVSSRFGIESSRQRLIFAGKQLQHAEGYTLFDYDIKMNSLISLMVRVVPLQDATNKSPAKAAADENHKKFGESNGSSEKENRDATGTDAGEENKEPECDDAESSFYRVGDFVDVKDMEGGEPTGAWFDAEILRVVKPVDVDVDKPGSDGLLYKVSYSHYPESFPYVAVDVIRPRAQALVPFESLRPGVKVMASVNLDEEKVRGHWYDCEVTKVDAADGRGGRYKPYALVTLTMGRDNVQVPDAKVTFIDDVMERMPAMVKIADRSASVAAAVKSDRKREYMPDCSKCNDDPNVNCKRCACQECNVKKDDDKTLVCDECQDSYHTYCLSPPLEAVPDDDWYCKKCKLDTSEIVGADGKLKFSKKKAKMASKVNDGGKSREWGGGMATEGRTKVCTKVAANHFGPIPGVEVGMCWLYRLQVSEEGIHRPHVAGISGRAGEGAFSIVLSGGYEDDVDDGDEFHYTGSGGRDLSGNKRTAEQSMDQELTATNKAIAFNCAAKINEKDGADAGDEWRNGKPVRVVRNFKLSKHSKYAPKEGNRYDGIYKVVKYWGEKGKSGFKVWRYLFRRDDHTPAPWTHDGRARMERLGFECIYPEGYEEQQRLKAEKQAEKEAEKEAARAAKGGGKDAAATQKNKRECKRNERKSVYFQVEKDAGDAAAAAGDAGGAGDEECEDDVEKMAEKEERNDGGLKALKSRKGGLTGEKDDDDVIRYNDEAINQDAEDVGVCDDVEPEEKPEKRSRIARKRESKPTDPKAFFKDTPKSKSKRKGKSKAAEDEYDDDFIDDDSVDEDGGFYVHDIKVEESAKEAEREKAELKAAKEMERAMRRAEREGKKAAAAPGTEAGKDTPDAGTSSRSSPDAAEKAAPEEIAKTEKNVEGKAKVVNAFALMKAASKAEKKTPEGKPKVVNAFAMMMGKRKKPEDAEPLLLAKNAKKSKQDPEETNAKETKQDENVSESKQATSCKATVELSKPAESPKQETELSKKSVQDSFEEVLKKAKKSQDDLEEANNAKKSKPNPPEEPKSAKKPKQADAMAGPVYEIEPGYLALIAADAANAKLWAQTTEGPFKTRLKFFDKIEENFSCISCMDIVARPITPLCGHNSCLGCLKRSWKAEVYSCAACRQDLGKDFQMAINENLREALKEMFPGYENGRD